MLRRSVWVVSILVASMLGAIFGPALASAVVPGAVASDEALVYVPVVPCKVFAGIQLDGEGSGDVETVDVAGIPGSANQGQDVCALTVVPAEAVAVSLNLIAQSVKARGNLQIGPSGGNTESVVNYVNTVDMNNSTELTVEVNNNGLIDLQAGGGATVGIANVVTAKGVLLGYYIPGDSVYESFDRTVVVGGSGTDAENGAALLAAITAVTAQGPSGLDPWLIKLEPGTFTVGSSALSLSNGMNLEGSGIGITTIVGRVNVNSDSTTISEFTTENPVANFSTGLDFTGQGSVRNVHAIGEQGAVLFRPSAGQVIEATGLIAESRSGLADVDVLVLVNPSDGDAIVFNSRILGTETTDGVILGNGNGTLTLVDTFVEDTTAAATASTICRAITNPSTFLPTSCS